MMRTSCGKRFCPGRQGAAHCLGPACFVLYAAIAQLLKISALTMLLSQNCHELSQQVKPNVEVSSFLSPLHRVITSSTLIDQCKFCLPLEGVLLYLDCVPCVLPDFEFHHLLQQHVTPISMPRDILWEPLQALQAWLPPLDMGSLHRVLTVWCRLPVLGFSLKNVTV
ncbi:unnamed protein product [Choristocarpus tenellus]